MISTWESLKVVLQEAIMENDPIPGAVIAMLSTWRHSGFHVFCGNRISPDDDTAMENLARHITTDTIATSRGENGRRKAAMTSFPESSNREE